MPFMPASNALSHLKVVDLTRVRAGPTCARQFADWGADVIMVEMPAPPPATPGASADFGGRHGGDFQNLHRNKRSITLDLKSPQGIDVLHKLVADADVVVENYRPDVKRRLGIDYESLRTVNPRLVYTSISGFGQDGPYGHRAGVDQIAQGMGGMMSITGHEGGGPLRAGIALSDMAAGMFGALGTLTALLEREISGEGQWVQTSLLQAQIFMLDFQAARWLVDGDVPGQAGNDHPTSVPMGCFETADRPINVAPMPQHFGKFCDVLGRPELAENEAFATPGKRLKNRAMLNEAVAHSLRQQSSAHWIAAFNEAGIPCGPVNTIDEVFADPQVQHLAMAQAVASKALGDINLVAQPMSMSRSQSDLVRATPERGENNNEILAELGYSDADIADLIQSHIL
jgi:crotonobetainyl-CoA:carnitine CoA-transferase CaiB-like acyl-CoA transferase